MLWDNAREKVTLPQKRAPKPVDNLVDKTPHTAPPQAKIKNNPPGTPPALACLVGIAYNPPARGHREEQSSRKVRAPPSHRPEKIRAGRSGQTNRATEKNHPSDGERVKT